ncbi:MAG: GNAT superfamily N-acetyltransferase [Verrucomicrobiales bacterium]|jgi:GNAT superfamily N-acetyltransferase
MQHGSTSPLKLKWKPRLAIDADIAQLKQLIPRSVRELQAPCYSTEQREAALGSVFAVDRQLIVDRTYFVVENSADRVIGCGGWSRRRSLYGGDSQRTEPDPELDPKGDPARVRAFFVDPEWARQGIGRSIMQACEEAIVAAQFRSAEIVATLAGEPLYASFGYSVTERFDIVLENGIRLPAVRMFRRLDGESR